MCGLFLLAAPAAAEEVVVTSDSSKPAATLADLAPASGVPAIPDPDPLTITPLMPLTESDTAPMPPVSTSGLDDIVTDLPALTPVPANKVRVSTISDTPAQTIPNEPPPALSKASKDIANKMPRGIDTKKPVSKIKLDIDHAKDTKYISAVATPVSEDLTYEAMGIKIQVKKSPLNFDYELEKAYNAIVAGHTEVAIEIYDRILANDPNNKAALFGLATSYHRAGQIDRARPLYGKVLTLDPGNRDALNNFLVLLGDEAPQEALDQMAALEDKNPGFSAIPAQMAVIYQKMGNLDKASDKMFKAVGLAPENLTYRYNLAIMLDKQEKFEEARKLYKQLLDASSRGEVIPGNARKIQERLTFLSSNRP